MKEELKTLKDLEELFSPMKRVYGGEDFISANIIREEAKKWIKQLTQEHHNLCDGCETTLERNFDGNRGCSISDDGCICDICHTLRIIKTFFGLKKEE